LIGKKAPAFMGNSMGFFSDLFNGNRSSTDKNGLRTNYTKWHFEDHRLVCSYEFHGLPTVETSVSLQIECWVTKYLNGSLGAGANFVFRPYQFLAPFFLAPLDPDGQLTRAPFSVGLVSSQPGKGTERWPLVQGGVFEVDAYLSDDDTVVLRVASRNAEHLCFRAIWPGKEMNFTISNSKTTPPSKGLQLRLPKSRSEKFLNPLNQM
jgi:hypothetical protein